MDNPETEATLGTQIRRQTKQNTQHNMCQTPPHTRHKTKTNKTKYTTQYVLDTTIHKTKTNKIKYTPQYVLDTTIPRTKVIAQTHCFYGQMMETTDPSHNGTAKFLLSYKKAIKFKM